MLCASTLATATLFAASSQKGDLSKLFERVRGCVFEVVVPKPVDTGATYAERLPLENLSFQERHDSVWSIGSAFAVGRDTVLTASHVMGLGEDDPAREPMLRDATGRIFHIGKMLKYSNHEDFALFTVPGMSVKQPLRPAKNLGVGKTVHAVGNALGEGIVLRDGLLTSQTPEKENGEWKYWRFSAAASPGNSGGPLVDANGGLVGVVLMKSESENLNYALPWAVVSAFGVGKGRYHERSGYAHPSLVERELVTVLDTTFALPSGWKDLDHLVWGIERAKAVADRDSLLRSEASEFFPRGKSGRLRIIPIMQNLPTTIEKGADGWWMLSVRKSGDPVDLGGNGVWISNADDGLVRASIRLPDNEMLTKYVDDSRKLGDLLLLGGHLTRNLAGKEIRVTSLGKAVVDSLRVDRWGRPWLVRAWRQPWDGDLFYAHLLPVPGGFHGLLQVMGESQSRSFLGQRMEDIADATFSDWDGSASRWAEWNARPELVPTFLKSLQFDRSPAQVTWNDGKLRLVPDLERPMAKPVLVVYPSFQDVGVDSVRLGIGGVGITSDGTGSRFAMAMRVAPPGADLSPDIQMEWQNRIEGRAPFDGSSLDQGNGKKMSMKVSPASQRIAKVDPSVSPPVWMISVLLDGAPTQSQLDKALQKTIAATKFPTESVGRR